MEAQSDIRVLQEFAEGLIDVRRDVLLVNDRNEAVRDQFFDLAGRPGGECRQLAPEVELAGITGGPRKELFLQFLDFPERGRRWFLAAEGG
jgi:hypothetical protein